MELHRVLIIDDSPTEARVLSGVLSDHRFIPSVAHSGEAGVAKAFDEIPDVILMDIVMPGLNGFQATRRLARDPVTTTIPIIVISTKGQAIDRIWGLRQGARDYLVKPVILRSLIDAIRGVLRL